MLESLYDCGLNETDLAQGKGTQAPKAGSEVCTALQYQGTLIRHWTLCNNLKP